jgi:primosomal protein N' (replication factor Y) (superfamily II helicase)
MRPDAIAPVARIALDIPRAGCFDYAAPGVTADDIGRIAVVPFGNRRLAGLIVELADRSAVPAAKLREVILVQRAWPRLTSADLALFRFCADYYHHALGAVVMNAVPPRLRGAQLFRRPAARAFFPTGAGRARLAAAGRAKALLALLADICEGICAESALRARHGGFVAKVAKLMAEGAVTVADAPAAAPNLPHRVEVDGGPVPNEEQARAIDAVDAAAGRFVPFLLDGITGSGKTEVYLHAVARAIARGGQALVLVPEINLTPQFLRHIETRLPGARIAALHSALNATERTARYLLATEGQADIVIGTRLAVFTPMPRLNLVVVDEEHDASFKQQEGLRYSARDIALFRAKHMSCPAVLGSATPSLETLANVERRRFTHLVLTKRANPAAKLPVVGFIDLDRERIRDGLSGRLIEEVRATLARGEQSLLFINRRGFAPALLCTQCGHIPACTRCSARLVFHRREQRLRCHHCGEQTRIPEVCSECKSIVVVAVGEGTERIESALTRLFPDARIARADRDAVRRKGDMDRLHPDAGQGARFSQAHAGRRHQCRRRDVLGRLSRLRAAGVADDAGGRSLRPRRAARTCAHPNPLCRAPVLSRHRPPRLPQIRRTRAGRTAHLASAAV